MEQRLTKLAHNEKLLAINQKAQQKADEAEAEESASEEEGETEDDKHKQMIVRNF